MKESYEKPKILTFGGIASAQDGSPPPHKPKPKYEPEKWNDDGPWGIDCTCDLATETKKQCKNNCYNYATNIQTNTYAQPGRASGKMFSRINCAEVTAAAIADGLIKLQDGKDPCPKCCFKVALVIAPGTDYHWYRQDDNGKWSHKPGKTAATNLDNSGNEIGDPSTADRGPYTDFCGYFCVCETMNGDELKIKVIILLGGYLKSK